MNYLLDREICSDGELFFLIASFTGFISETAIFVGVVLQ